MNLKYNRILVYGNRIISIPHRKVPHVTVWLDVENGDIPWNGSASATSPPIATDTPFAIEVGDTFVTLSWVPNPNNHATLYYYKVNITNNAGVVQHSQNTANQNNMHTYTGLSPNQLYYFTITKVTSMGEYTSYPSPYVDLLSAHSDAHYPPSNGILEVTTLFAGTDAAPPNSLSGTASTTSVSLSWNAGSHNDATFLSYTINREEAGGTIIASVQGITGTSYTWTDLDAGQQYYFTVQKVTNRGTTSKSNQFSTSTTDSYGTNPGVPSLQSRNLKSVTFKWSPGSIGSGTLVRHNLVRYNDSGGIYVHSRQESTGTYAGNISITWSEELEPETNYYFRSEMIVNYSGSNTTTTSVNVFTFSYSKEFPSPAVMFTGGGFTKSSSSFNIGWRMESHGDYTLEKVVIHWVNSGYTYVSYGSSSSFEDNIWNNTTTLTSYINWYDFSIQSEKKDIYPAELETYATTSYGTLGYVYDFVFNNPDNVASNYTYDIVVEKVYSDLNLSEYSYNGVNNIPVISRSYPYSTGSTSFKGIELIYGSHTSTGSPRGIIITIDLTGIETEVITSITYTKHPLTFVEYHGSSPWTEERVITNPTREPISDIHSYVFLPNEYTLVNNTMYNLGAVVVTTENIYARYTNFVYTA